MVTQDTVAHEWDWWAYQFRVVHRQGIAGIDTWDDCLVAFIVRVFGLKPGERLLDLACGSGVHALRLARLGLKVVGLDIAPSLVRYSAAQAAAEGLGNVTFVEGDMRALVYREEFNAVTVLSTSFGFFDNKANQRVLDSISRALKPGGRVLLQLMDPVTFVERLTQSTTHQEERPEGIYSTESCLDPATFICYSVFRFTDHDGVTHLWDDQERIRIYTLPELRHMFDQAGLELCAAYGDILLPPVEHGPDCHRQMIVVGMQT